MSQVMRSRLPGPTHKLILIMLADYANNEGVCWPSLATMATYSQLSRRQIQRILKDLRDGGLLEIAKPATGVLATMYRVRGDKLTPLGGDTMTPQGRHHDTPGVTPTSPPYISETINETINRNHDPQVAWLESRYKRGKGRSK